VLYRSWRKKIFKGHHFRHVTVYVRWLYVVIWIQRIQRLDAFKSTDYEDFRIFQRRLDQNRCIFSQSETIEDLINKIRLYFSINLYKFRSKWYFKKTNRFFLLTLSSDQQPRQWQVVLKIIHELLLYFRPSHRTFDRFSIKLFEVFVGSKIFNPFFASAFYKSIQVSVLGFLRSRKTLNRFR